MQTIKKHLLHTCTLHKLCKFSRPPSTGEARAGTRDPFITWLWWKSGKNLRWPVSVTALPLFLCTLLIFFRALPVFIVLFRFFSCSSDFVRALPIFFAFFRFFVRSSRFFVSYFFLYFSSLLPTTNKNC